MFRRYSLFLIAFFVCQAMAQENIPTTSDALIEVLTASLEKNTKAQRLQVLITSNTATQGQAMRLQMTDVSAVPVLISASRGDEPLWLIQSETANENAAVLSWRVDENNYLQISPGNWSAPYEITLEIQISLNNIKDLENIENTRLDLFLSSGDVELIASSTGRGNQISLKNTQE